MTAKSTITMSKWSKIVKITLFVRSFIWFIDNFNTLYGDVGFPSSAHVNYQGDFLAGLHICAVKHNALSTKSRDVNAL